MCSAASLGCARGARVTTRIEEADCQEGLNAQLAESLVAVVGRARGFFDYFSSELTIQYARRDLLLDWLFGLTFFGLSFVSIFLLSLVLSIRTFRAWRTAESKRKSSQCGC
jgi:hypothetical protein